MRSTNLETNRSSSTLPETHSGKLVRYYREIEDNIREYEDIKHIIDKEIIKQTDEERRRVFLCRPSGKAPFLSFVGQLALLNVNDKYNAELKSILEDDSHHITSDLLLHLTADVAFAYGWKNRAFTDFEKLMGHIETIDEEYREDWRNSYYQGLAFAEHHSRIQNLLENEKRQREGNPYLDVPILRSVFCGYAMALNTLKVEEYLNNWFKESVKFIKLNNKTKQVDFRESEKKRDVFIKETINVYASIINGFAIASHQYKPLDKSKLINHKAPIGKKAPGRMDEKGEEEKKSTEKAIKNVYKYLKFANRFINEQPIKGNKVAIFNKLLETAIRGFVISGNHKHIEIIRRKYNLPNEIIIDCYNVETNLNKSENFDLITLLTNYFERRKERYIKSGEKQYFLGSLSSFFGGKSYNEKKEAVEALQLALKGEAVLNLKAHLPVLQDGHLGKLLRRFIKSGKADVIVPGNPRTITQFIDELDKQVQHINSQLQNN